MATATDGDLELVAVLLTAPRKPLSGGRVLFDYGFDHSGSAAWWKRRPWPKPP